ncbi:MAG TPA: AAA family ATPase, partial [Paludibacter sp.]|nr:AAA family ATPase [Paludibacter sp.]
DPKWGLQYDLVFMNQSADLTKVDEQKIFLSKILTSKQFDAIYNEIENPFEVIQKEDVSKLTKVKGIGLTTAVKIIERYKETIDYSDAYVKLHNLGLTDTMVKKLCSAYKSPQVLIEKFEENPYILCEDIDGIGFKRADEFAKKYGIEPNSPKRIKSYVKYCLNSEAQLGNSWIDTQKLVNYMDKELGITDKKTIGSTLLSMENLWWSHDKKKIGLSKIYDLEKNIADELIRLLNAPNHFKFDNWEDKIKEIEENIGFEYTDEQVRGVEITLKNNVVCITGLAGSGKTTITKAIIKILGSYNFAQCALAGKASQRMSEVTGYEGYTIHRLLGFEPPAGFAYNKNNNMPYDIIIVDETSMIGGELFYDLIQAIKTGAKLIILGDSGQLPSIGTCNVFHDLLNNGTIPTVKLNKIHRQAQKSAVITESRKIRNREQIIEKGFTGKQILGELQDLELDIYADKSESAKKIITQFKEKLPLVKSVLDLQVLVAMKDRGDICTYILNKAFQLIVNPTNSEKIEVEMTWSKELKYKLREGDKVIDVRNNYKTLNLSGDVAPVFNGNIGIIEKINLENGLMVVNFENVGRIIVKKEDWSDIQLGYVITTHKSQGSQWEYVIVGVDYGSYMSLSCEWLYTAITRTQKYCVLVGENQAIRYATSVTKTPTKQTHLCEILKHM